jgi:murein DD-endopeptidase MepM/ murein hydrolase activator NlpD
MSMQFPHEPTPDHLADTGPSQAVQANDRQPAGGCRRTMGCFSLIGALALTVSAAVLLLTMPSAEVAQIPAATQIVVVTSDAPTVPAPTAQPDAAVTTAPGDAQPVSALPTIAPDELFSLLMTPVAALNFENPADRIQIAAPLYEPFTIIPDRPRGEVIQYEVQSGDTIFRIAELFGLKPESIAWANERSIIGGLRPGRMINILPVDGVYYTVPQDETIQSVANRFRVEPYTIIDSEYNSLFGATPETLLPTGARVVVPGGTAESIVWAPPVQRVGGDSSRGGAGGRISFARGEAGSCGLVDNPGGGASWVRPVATGSYQWTRGFTSLHPGVDLAGAVGTPIFAANSGTVIFAGWNSYGYGYAVVLAHGAYTTVYGHLSAVNVGCGQFINAGQVVGAMGATGNASGPHLHFEIRYNDVPQNPTTAIAF